MFGVIEWEGLLTPLVLGFELAVNNILPIAAVMLTTFIVWRVYRVLQRVNGRL